MIYLCVAYLVIWALIFGYLFFLRNKQKELLARLEKCAPEARR